MRTAQLGSTELCALAHDLVNVVQQYQYKQHAHTTLQMRNTRMGEWDEICVMAIDEITGTEKLIIKISLSQLTPAERSQLQLQIGLHNQTLLDPGRFTHENNQHLVH